MNWIKQKIRNWLFKDELSFKNELTLRLNTLEVPHETIIIQSKKFVDLSQINQLEESMRITKEASLQLIKNEMIHDLMQECLKGELIQYSIDENGPNGSMVFSSRLMVVKPK